MVIFFLNWVVRLYILSHISYLSEKLLWNIYNMNKVMNTTAVISVMPDYQTLEDTRKVFLQPSHPLSSPAPTVPNPSQHQGLFQ